MAAFKHGMALPGQRTLDLGRVRTASIHLSCLRMCQKNKQQKQKRVHTLSLINSLTHDWTFLFFLPLCRVTIKHLVRLFLHPSPGGQPLSLPKWESGGRGEGEGAQLPSIIHKARRKSMSAARLKEDAPPKTVSDKKSFMLNEKYCM